MRSNGRAFQVVEVGALEGVLINAAASPLRADIRQSMSQLLHSFSVTARREATSQKYKGTFAEPPERRINAGSCALSLPRRHSPAPPSKRTMEVAGADDMDGKPEG